MDDKRFRKLFPHLAEELDKRGNPSSSYQMWKNRRNQGGETPRKWAGHDPDVVDFIRRCDSEEQAEEIIRYLEERGEITPEHAADLRSKLREEGLRSVGGKKEAGYYHKNP